MKNTKITADNNVSLNEVTYERVKLVAKGENIYTVDGKYMFDVPVTDRAKNTC